MSDIDLLLEQPVQFIPLDRHGGEWPAVEDWADDDWAQWLREHNRYSYLRPYTEAEIQQYLTVDRYRYGLGFQRKGGEMRWFYNPAPVAVPFHASKLPNILFGGAAGGTKTHSARHDAYRHCFSIPEMRVIIMRRTYGELKDNHLDAALSEEAKINDFLGKQAMKVYTGDSKEIWFNVHGPGKESKIVFGHCQNEGDEERYLGNAYDLFYPDEMATFTKKQITGVAGRLRTKKRGVMASLRGTSNPGGAQTLWLKDYFIDRDEASIVEHNPKYRADKYGFLGAMLWDNPYYMDPNGTYESYEARLFDYDPERRRQLLLGDWNALTGQFFPEFNRSHVAVIDIPAGCKIERWIDWGYDPNYGVVLWVACLPNGRLYVFYEWRFNGSTARQKLVASEVAEKIRTYTLDEVLPLAKSRRITRSIGDTQMWSISGSTGESYEQTFARQGVSMQQADKDRVMGWGRMRHWLRNAPDGHPWIIFHPRCETCIRTIPGLVRDKNDPEDLDTAGEDHAADTIRYGVMGRPSPTMLKESLPIIISYSPAEILREMRPQVRRPGMVS